MSPVSLSTHTTEHLDVLHPNGKPILRMEITRLPITTNLYMVKILASQGENDPVIHEFHAFALEAETPAATEVPTAEPRPRPAVNQGGPSSDRAEPTP